jgi:hypothetical protein
MSVSIPPAGARRPWYLVVALAITMFFGAAGWISGCNTIAEYRDPNDAFEHQVEALQTSQDRDTARAAHERYLTALDGAKKRQFPVGVAEFLLGAAMLALTIRAIAGRPGARALLVQLTAGQATLVLVAYFLTSDARAAWLTQYGITGHLLVPPDPIERALWHPGMIEALAGAVWSAWIGVRSLLSVIAVVALTRQRTRDFFEAVAPLSER